MKNIILWIAISVYAMGSEYYSKAEPYRFYTLQASVSGLIVKADENMEGKILSNEAFIIIDDEIDRKELNLLDEKKSNLQRSLELNKKMAANLEMIISRKNENYERIKDLPIKSTIEKDKEFFDLANTQNQLLSTLEKIETIASQLNDTQLRLEQLRYSLKKKHLEAKGMVLYKLYAKKGQVVAPGMNLAEVADITKAKLTLFLNSDELDGVREKKIYLNDKASEYTIDKIWPLSDEEHISSYKTEILIDAPKQFSALYKIEFK
ncbi:MAG: HlyD family secretion protein [Campylobacterales bacterium]|nr:HlyD family secretion protein [Campylobacterales bacterium]